MEPPKTNKITLKVFAAFLSSWIVTLVGALTIIVLLFATLYTLRDEAYEMVAFVVAIIAILIFVVIRMALYRYRHRIFVKYMRLALLFGAVGLIGIALLMMVGSTIVSISNSNNDTSTRQCVTKSEAITKTQSATYPIATDLGTGTAFAIDKKGTLLTAYHVVEGAKRVYGNFVSGKVPIKVLKTAPEYDIALLRISQPTPDYVNLTNEYMVGDYVYAFGYPRNGLEAGQATLSAGILSRVLTNSDLKLNSKKTPKGLEIVQTDAPVNPGNSGGPLFGKCGTIGVVTAKSDSLQLGEYGLTSEEGITYVVSSKTAAKKFGLKLVDN